MAETERLVLRDFETDDFEDVHAYASDYETVRHMAFGPNTREDTRRYLEEQCPRERDTVPRTHWNAAIRLKDGGRVIGGISLHMNWRRDDAILGAVLNRHFAGRGLMTEAMLGAMRFAFEALELHRLHAVCAADNPGIIRVLEKCGFRREGRMIKRGRARPEAGEPYFDQYGYAILREEYRTLQRQKEEM